MIGILGTHSYICNSFIDYIANKNICIEQINCRDNGWKLHSFSNLDSVICPIGIAHVSTDPSMETMYYKINRDLPFEIACKAKQEGVKHFIFFSSMIVYGKDKPIGEEYIIDSVTEPYPENFYGKSKLEAEKLLLDLSDENFKVSILRLPMVYGPKCKGNFPKLLKMAEKLPILPSIENKRSMIYIENLCEYILQCLLHPQTGIFYPQNTEYVSTLQVIKTASKFLNKKKIYISLFNPILKLLSKKIDVLNRIFGKKIYDKSLSPDLNTYNLVDFETSIKRTLEL